MHGALSVTVSTAPSRVIRGRSKRRWCRSWWRLSACTWSLGPSRASAGPRSRPRASSWPFEILCKLQRVHGAGVLAQAAEHAPGSVVGNVVSSCGGSSRFSRYSPRSSPRGRPARTDCRRCRVFAGFRIVVETRRATVALCDLGPFGGYCSVTTFQVGWWRKVTSSLRPDR